MIYMIPEAGINPVIEYYCETSPIHVKEEL